MFILRPATSTEFGGCSHYGSQISWGRHICKVLPGCIKQHSKTPINTHTPKYTKILNEDINKIAVCGGSGSFLVNDAIKKGADVFITSDFKYHDFFEANDKIVLLDIGHYESEQFTKDLIFEFLNKNLINIALHLTDENTNPIKYFK